MWGSFVICRCVAMTLIVGLAAAISQPAKAHRMHPAETVSAASHQRVLARVMLKDIMLLSLQVEPVRALSSLRRSRASFDELMEQVGSANAELLAQSETVPNDLLERYAEVLALWREFDRSILDALAARRVAAGQVRPLLDLGVRFGDSMDRLYDGYRTAANHYGVISVLGRAMEVGERAQAASQRAFAEFFALAHAGEGAGEPHILVEHMNEVGGRIESLIDGDPGNGVLPAPTRDIRQQLISVQTMWEAVQPVMSAIAVGDAVASQEIAVVAQISVELLDSLAEADFMLAALMPAARRPEARRFSQPQPIGTDDAGT